MTVITRRVAARPARTASETWALITGILFSSHDEGRALCAVASGVASSVIAEELPASTPFVLVGAGPRVRIYTLYDEDALDEPEEMPVRLDLDGRDWYLWVPCAKEDLGWAEPAVASARRCRLYDAAIGIPDEATKGEERSASVVQIDVNLFRDL